MCQKTKTHEAIYSKNRKSKANIVCDYFMDNYNCSNHHFGIHLTHKIMKTETQVFERAWIHFQKNHPELNFKSIVDDAVQSLNVTHHSELSYEDWMHINIKQQSLINQTRVVIMPGKSNPKVQMSIMNEWRSKSKNYGYGMD